MPRRRGKRTRATAGQFRKDGKFRPMFVLLSGEQFDELMKGQMTGERVLSQLGMRNQSPLTDVLSKSS